MNRLATVVALIVIVVGAGPGWAAAPFAASSERAPNAEELYAALRPDLRADIVAATSDRLPVYAIDATVDFREAGSVAPPAVVTGSLNLAFVNATETTLPELYLRLYANDPRFQDGGTVLRNVTVAGAPTASELSVDDTVARLPLAEPLPPGGTVDVGLDFTTTVVQTYEIFNLLNIFPRVGSVTLAHWYPILAGFDPVSGWVLDPVSRQGDLVFSDTALYDVSLTLPAGMTAAATGVEIAATDSGDRVRREFVTGPVREFTAIADDDFASVSREVAGTTIVSYANPSNALGMAAALDYAERALTLFNDHYGPYPYVELDLVEWPLWSCCGMEFPQLMGFNDSLYVGINPAPGQELELTVAHEIAHQWWYGLVGNNHYLHAFMDEGLASLSEVIYLEGTGDGAAAQTRYDRLPNSDQIVDQPTDLFPTGQVAYNTIYGKGTLGFQALRVAIGDAAFFAGLRDYVARERFGVAQPADLLAALDRSSGRELDEIWHLWFELPGLQPPPELAPVSARRS
jgi:hypothetical protein